MEENDYEKRNSDLRESLIYKNTDSFKFRQVFIVILITIITAIIVGIIVYIINTESSKEEKEDITNHYSIISCIYKIDDNTTEISILGDDYENIDNSIKSININDISINFTKKYLFNETGIYQIEFILNKKINMDNIFKNVQNIQKVELFSNSSDKIISMKSAFEGCSNLNYISINGFNTDELKSMSKIFYNTSIIELNFTNFKTSNVVDMSHMFANSKNVELTIC